VFRFTEPSDKTRLEPVLGPARDRGSGQELTITRFTQADSLWAGAVRPSRRPRSLSSGRAKRGPVGCLLKMRAFLHAVKSIPHAEERSTGAFRSTHGGDAAFRWDGSDALQSPEPLERAPAADPQRWWTRLRGPVGSLILHLLPLLLLIDWPMSPPAKVTPIPVQLVFEPPPQPKPESPKPQPKPTPPPPRGRLASEDLGDHEAKETDRPKGDAPTATDNPAKADNPPSEAKEKPQQTAAVVPPPLPLSKSDAPKPDAIPKPAQKPSPAAHQPPRRVEEPGSLAPRHAKFPGPAATRDEYLAYMHSLIRQHYNLLTPAALGDRRGMVVVEFVVLDDGKVALIKVRRSSGYPDIDDRVAEMVAAVGRFPPLPQWFQGIAMPFEFGFPFPEALRE
jgi:TonB family protein